LYEKNSRHNRQSITQQRTYNIVNLDFISRYVDGDDCYGFADDYGDDYNDNDSGVMFDTFHAYAVPLTARTIKTPLTFHSIIVPFRSLHDIS